MLQQNILVWNCRGIANNETQDALVDLVFAKKPSLIFLSETLAHKQTIEDITRKLGFADFHCVPHETGSQGLALIWTADLHVDVQSDSPNHIDSLIGSPGSDVWRFTGIYGVAARGGREHTWNLIHSLSALLKNIAWIMAGDFNEVLCRKDKTGGPPRALSAMTRFRRTLAHADLHDLGFVGSRFTWYCSNTKERLDRGVATMQWKRRFPYSRVLTLPLTESDHCPLLIEVCSAKPSVRHRRQRLVRFEEAWHESEECTEIIKQEWSTPVTGNLLTQIAARFRSMGGRLMSWHATAL